MKINKVKVNSYGKLKNKEINFKDGINIIYGQNESGKTTLIKFLVNSFYGISKNKKGKELSDYDKYKPWEGEEFSGKIEYELDNKNKYEIYRDFNKKNPQIFNEKMEDISKQFNINKNKGNEFFYEQTKIDEDLFLSTLAINQQEVILEKQEQNILIQKIANLVGTGDDNISYKRAIDRINRRQLDEVGTERSREKPINIISKKVENLEQKKQELEKYKSFKYQIEEQEKKLILDIENLENENEILKEIKLLLQNEEIEQEKINLKENLKEKDLEKINLLDKKINEIKADNKDILEKNVEKNKKIKSNKNKTIKKISILFVILILVNLLIILFVKNKFKYMVIITIPMFLALYIFFINKEKIKIKEQEKIEKNNFEEINIEIKNLENEKKLIEKNYEDLQDDIKNLKNNFNLKNNVEKEKIKNSYLNKIEENKIDIFIQLNSLQEINFEIENLQNELNNKKLKLHTMDLDKKNIEPQLDNLARIDEELVDNHEQIVNLKNLNLSMNLAKEILNESYEKMKNQVTPKFTENLSNNIFKITNGKYKKVIFREEDGLIIELENGNYISSNRLSTGTIDQLYLSLRLSMIDELSEEIIPIMLDEAFAFYDDERLKNILDFLNKRFKDRQIIIFTCTDREKSILEDSRISFNYIRL